MFLKIEKLFLDLINEIMKNYIILAIAGLFLLLYSCENTQAPEQDTYINAKSLIISNTFYRTSDTTYHDNIFLTTWDIGNTKLKAVFDYSIVIAETGIDSNTGKFELTLPGKMNTFYLTKYFQQLGLTNISDLNLKTTQFLDLSIDFTDIDGLFKLDGIVYLTSQGKLINRIKLIYADRNATVKSSFKNIDYDLNLKKGWNCVGITDSEHSVNQIYKSVSADLNSEDMIYFVNLYKG